MDYVGGIKRVLGSQECLKGRLSVSDFLPQKDHQKILFDFYGNIPVAFVSYIETDDGIDVIFLTTHERYRRQGRMSKLIQKLKKSLKNGQRIFLELRESNLIALKFYQTEGFSQIGVRPCYYKGNIDAICLSWTCQNELSPCIHL